MNYNIKISTYRPLDLIGKNDHNLTLVWQFGIDCNDKQSCADVDKIVLLQVGGNKIYTYCDMDGMYYARMREGIYNTKDFLNIIGVMCDYVLTN
jgi:hypothetical protein